MYIILITVWWDEKRFECCVVKTILIGVYNCLLSHSESVQTFLFSLNILETVVSKYFTKNIFWLSTYRLGIMQIITLSYLKKKIKNLLFMRKKVTSNMLILLVILTNFSIIFTCVWVVILRKYKHINKAIWTSKRPIQYTNLRRPFTIKHLTKQNVYNRKRPKASFLKTRMTTKRAKSSTYSYQLGSIFVSLSGMV